MPTIRLLTATLVLLAVRASGQGFELDLTDPQAKPVRPILVLPPVTRVTSTSGFAGLERRRTTEKFDTQVHARLVQAFKRELGTSVLDADAVLGLLRRQGLGAPQLKSAAAVANLGAVTKATWVIRFEYTRPALAATVYDATGTQAGESVAFEAPQGVTEALAARVATAVHARLTGLDVPAPEPVEPRREPVAPPPVEDLTDADLQVKAPAAPPSPALADPARVRGVLLVAFGAVSRSLDASSGTASLAALQGNAFAGWGAYLRLLPLNWFAATQGQAGSDLELEVHYRRALVGSVAVAGGTTTCPLTDDDLQGRLTWRYRLRGSALLPALGLGVGLSQEQTLADCTAAVPSLVYRGLDLQLRVRQPLVPGILALDLAFGPRVLFSGPQAPSPGFSFAAELWLEATPWSVLFVRGGARLSRLALANAALGLGFTDLRVFAGVELGLFL